MRGVVAPLVKLLTFLVITTVATYVLAITIANSSFGDTYSYKADFTDVTGLNLNDDVRIAGVRVGTVDDIQLKKGDATHKSYTQVTFTVEKSRSLPTSVFARLRYRNLVGQRYIDVEQVAGTDDKAPVLKPGGTITLDHTSPAVDLTVLFQGFTNLTDGLAPDQINKLSYSLIQALQGEGGALQGLLSNVASLTNTLADKDKVIGEVIDNLSSVLTTVGQRDSELTALIVNLRTLVSGLAGDRTTIGNSIDGINNLATSTAGLLTQIRDPLKRDVVSLTGLVNTLNNNGGVLQQVIQQLPTTLAPLIRTASYGSWFNFYMCKAAVTVKLNSNSTTNLVNTGVVTLGAPGANGNVNVQRGC